MRRQKTAPEGALIVVEDRDGDPHWETKWRNSDGRQVKRRLGPAWLSRRDEPIPELSGWERRFRRRRGKAEPGFLTPNDAIIRKRELIDEAFAADRNRSVALPVMTFGAVADAWADEMEAMGSWKQKTARNYRTLLRRTEDQPRKRGRQPKARIMSAFGEEDISSITTPQIRDFLGELDRSELGPRSINVHRQVLSQIFSFARERGWVDSNPVDGTSKRKEPAPKELLIFPQMQLNAIVADMDAITRAFIICAAHTGLRVGELLALEWGDVDLDGGRILVQRSYSPGIGVDTPKSGKGRWVTLAKQAEEQLRLLDDRRHGSSPGELIFTETGTYMDPSTLRRRFYKGRDKAVAADPAVPADLKLHDLRHWFGSMAAAGGFDLVKVQSLMGHSSIATTQRYLHPHFVSEDAENLTRAFGG